MDLFTWFSIREIIPFLEKNILYTIALFSGILVWFISRRRQSSVFFQNKEDAFRSKYKRLFFYILISMIVGILALMTFKKLSFN